MMHREPKNGVGMPHLFTALWMFLFTAALMFFSPEVYAKPQKVIYLTFDDGPSAIYTPQVLNVLRREHVHATFFVLGYRCKSLPGIVRRTRREGHEIGSHGYDHRLLAHQPEAVLKAEIMAADTAIAEVTGRKPLYYRPTYGGLNRDELPEIRKMGHAVAFWTVDSQDWKAKSAATIVQTVEEHARPGSIILFHDGLQQSRLTVQALPTIIQYYRGKGYVFRTL